MDRPQLLEFLRSNSLGVLSTIGLKGQPQSALVGIAVTPEFEIVLTRSTARANSRISRAIPGQRSSSAGKAK